MRADGVLFKAELKVLDDLPVTSVRRSRQGVAAKIRGIGNVRRLFEIHGCIEEAADLFERPLLEFIP